jgi:NAD(P)-dependent dehydrogenase (short-subunit alcohol dehydrogenase family)/acyl dehydratase
LRVTREHLQRFADASGDVNPLHMDDGFARATPYGRRISHGALVTIAALGVADPTLLQHVRSIQIQFKQPVFPDEDYTISLVDSDSEHARIEVGGRGRLAATIVLTAEPEAAPIADVAEPLEPMPATRRESPQRFTPEDLASADPSFEEPYGCNLDGLDALADELGAAHCPRRILFWLAAASYTVGMVVPGEDAVFVGAQIATATARRTGVLSGSITAIDDRTGLVKLVVRVDQHDASATMTLDTFIRPRLLPPDRATIEQYLAPSTRLTGRQILVVGGSRGLGAALSGAFATQGATVWVGYAQSRGHAESLQSNFGGERIRLLRFDAEDVQDTRKAFEPLRAKARVLDGVVLCAAPPLYESSLDPAASETTLGFVRASLAMALIPLAEVRELLSPDGWLVIVSSSELENPPEIWPHYTIAKAALEGVATYFQRLGSTRVLVARAPQMWTDSTNTPLGRLAAVPREQVAAAIVHWALSDDDPRPRLLTGDDLS